MKDNIPILYYHIIKPPPKGTRIKGLYTNLKQFEWQLKFLKKRNFNFLTFKDILQENYDPNKRNIIITFDDGCNSLYYNAFPVLKKYGIKAVVYIVTNSIGEENVIWEQNENKNPLDILSVDQIKEMAEFGIEFGSHSMNHKHLGQLSENELIEDLSESKRVLENILNNEVYSIAYPYGTYSNKVLEITAKTGYLFGLTTKPGNNMLTNNYETCRINIKGHAVRHYWYFIKKITKILH